MLFVPDVNIKKNKTSTFKENFETGLKIRCCSATKNAVADLFSHVLHPSLKGHEMQVKNRLGCHLVRHALAVLLGSVDQRLIQVHHQDQLFVAVEPLLVFSAQLLCLLFKGNTRGRWFFFSKKRTTSCVLTIPEFTANGTKWIGGDSQRRQKKNRD